jgi:PAS domain S-box-containing protein
VKSKNGYLSFHHSLLNKVLKTNGESLCILDREKRYKFFNDTHKQLIETTTNNQIEVGDSFINLFEDECVRNELERNINKTLTGSELKVIQKLSSTGNGSSTVENNFIPFTDESEKIAGILIKSKKAVESRTKVEGDDRLANHDNVLAKVNNLDDNSGLINHALNSLTHGIVITDSKGIIVWANDAVTKFSGFNLSELKGQTPRIFNSEIHDESFFKKLWQTIKSGSEWKGELVNRKKNGSFYFEEMIITPILNDSREITHFIAIKQDITEQRQKEKELEKDSASLSLIVDKVPAVLWMVDSELLFLSSQGSALKQMGLKPNQVVGTTVYDFFKSKDKEYPPIKAHCDALKGSSRQFKLFWKGETFDAQVEPLRDKENRIIGCVGIAHNVTDRVKYEQALIESREKAELSNKLKSEFLAQMSHEIRTPLNVIISSASLLQEELTDSVDEDVYTSFELIDSAGRRIIRTIDLLLNMSEIHTGNYEYIKEEFNLNGDVLQQVFESYKFKANSKELQLVLSCQTDDTIISGDRHSILEIFSNLVDNAIKYTESGRVEIIVDKDEEGNLAVLIADTGIGISKDYLPHLFDKFTQEDEGYTRQYEGNGLGLALVKEYCALNNLTLDVESEKGSGTIIKILFNRSEN